ncbi:hypothetical protein EDC65_4079 [Stella humosa]|uniref:Uncharacterized protein n=1 Tax=Stella humosa TaxID=94 RepID=A0A3N1KVC4_9PROT|nr:hypothetical protein [Stella humosa]ROP83432.1 hypothetical protein EDC65_4079 [Stella humosa]BBK33296.1 hypothetical protein STHU_39300 [Stella humosa]
MRRTMIEKSLVAGALALGLAWAGAAAAQQVIVDPQQIAQCLCLEQTLAQRASEMNASRAAYDQRTADLDQLDQRIQRDRGMVNESDPAQVARFRDMIDRRDRLAADVDGGVIGALQVSVGRYNETVAQHRNMCGSRFYEQNVLERVRMTLVCPRG